MGATVTSPENPAAPVAAGTGTLAGTVGRRLVMAGVPDFAAWVTSGPLFRGPKAREVIPALV